MPGPVDGVALARWLHEQYPAVRVILTSGVVSSLDAAEQACANIRAFMPKPYQYDEMVDRIRAALAG
jgi:DNA-binding NarL/FixJ family response regulator